MTSQLIEKYRRFNFAFYEFGLRATELEMANKETPVNSPEYFSLLKRKAEYDKARQTYAKMKEYEMEAELRNKVREKRQTIEFELREAFDYMNNTEQSSEILRKYDKKIDELNAEYALSDDELAERIVAQRELDARGHIAQYINEKIASGIGLQGALYSKYNQIFTGIHDVKKMSRLSTLDTEEIIEEANKHPSIKKLKKAEKLRHDAQKVNNASLIGSLLGLGTAVGSVVAGNIYPELSSVTTYGIIGGGAMTIASGALLYPISSTINKIADNMEKKASESTIDIFELLDNESEM